MDCAWLFHDRTGTYAHIHNAPGRKPLHPGRRHSPEVCPGGKGRDGKKDGKGKAKTTGKFLS